MKEAIIGLILAEEGQEAGGKSINQLVANANANQEAILPREQVHCTHDALVVRKDGGCYDITFHNSESLMDVL